jgi:hypothetical protein
MFQWCHVKHNYDFRHWPHHPGFIGVLKRVRKKKFKKALTEDVHLSPTIRYSICAIFIIFGTGVLYKKLSCKHKFHENQLSNSHTLLKGINKWISTHTFHISWLTDPHVMLLRNYHFHKNQCSESHTLLRCINEFCCHFVHLSSNLDKIPYRSTRNAIQQLRLL